MSLISAKIGSADWNLWPITKNYSEIFHILKKQGIDNVELGIYLPSVELEFQKQQEILSASESSGINITAMLFSLVPSNWPVTAFGNLSSDFLQESKVFLETCSSMGVEHANIWTGVDLPSADKEQVSRTLLLLDALGSDFDGTISIEYKADTVFSTGANLAEFLQMTKNLKVLVDTGHAFALNENVVELINDLHERGLMGAMHLGDAISGDSDADLPCGRIHDFAPILEKLKEIEFSKSANFDLYGAVIDENGPGPIAILQESNAYLLDQISRLTG